MKLLSIKFTNIEEEWKYEKIELFDLTLLVGVSGVGKTQILKSIHTLKEIAGGQSVNGIKWELEFQTLKGNKYLWLGEFETINSANELNPEFFIELGDLKEPKIISEQIFLNDKIIIDRNSEKFQFNGNEMPKLNSTESAIHILKEEHLIKDIYENFNLIILRDHTFKIVDLFDLNQYRIEKLKNQFKTFEEIKKSDLNTFHKLVLIYDVSKSAFEEIKSRFIEVFPQVENIRVAHNVINEHSNFDLETSLIQIKEKNVQKWIPHHKMSSGMFRTLLHTAEMYLWNEGTVILIDEFENGLGLNCIDVLTEDLIYENNKIQFIATSHHPYIINKIPYDYWKIVTRKGGIIKAFDAKDFDLGKSHHDRFMNLINHPFYKQGIS